MAAFTTIEQEIVILKAVWDLIHEMVNYEMFAKLTQTDDVILMFNTRVHQRLFNILLVDFLSQPPPWPFGLPAAPRETKKSKQNLLFHLGRICDDPRLSPTGADHIKAPLDKLTDWLEAECCVENVWLPSINVETNITVKRVAFIKICGNIAKHNFTRLSVNIEGICGILRDNGTNIDTEHGYLVISEFYDWFHTHVLNYHGSVIAEFLNNIRWGVYNYLKPEFTRSFTRDDPISIEYRFLYPPDCNHPVVKSIYWDLMNEVRSEPFVPQFESSRHLKRYY
jgi:hypothetical protein